MLTISNIPALNDNYIWLLINDDKHCAVVDPSEAAPVLEQLEQQSLTLDAILVTHHHHDHTGGIDELIKHYPDVIVYGPRTPKIPQVTEPLTDGQKFNLFKQEVTTIQLSGHTYDHIGFYIKDMVFCGDTLFSGGCGRLFEGSPAQMFDALAKLSSLPDKTKVYCGHEYTQANLKFAQVIEPNNAILNEYAKKVDELREKGQSTLPTTIGQEKAINPFMRTQVPAVKSAVSIFAKDNSDLETFSALRRWKDNFKQ